MDPPTHKKNGQNGDDQSVRNQFSFTHFNVTIHFLHLRFLSEDPFLFYLKFASTMTDDASVFLKQWLRTLYLVSNWPENFSSLISIEKTKKIAYLSTWS